jgi:GDPmannose 4,6-dehydratase|tara:strand:- start:4211 stop:5194 length:984 start_codon:yes stop_codon:yes gene_type:complete
MKKKALILGITGQDGSYMLELLVKKKYQVHGLIRKSATGSTKNIDHIIKNNKIFNKSFFLHKGDLLDIGSLSTIVDKVKPDEIYNFADQDHVAWSFAIPSYSFKVTALSVIEVLELLKNKNKKIKYFHPISSNIFGVTSSKIQNEKTITNPNSVYALAKATALQACKMYSRTHNLFICGAIFYNHESPRRSEDYVTQKIVKSACEIYHGKKDYLFLGDLKAKIDWGYAKDYVECAWKIMQLKKPDFFVIATGKTYSVEYFVKNCFSYLGMDFKKYVRFDKKLIRAAKTSVLKGNISKAKKFFGYKPQTKLQDLIKIMMESELKKYNG